MAIEKGKVIAAIETKYKGKGLSKTFINSTAVKIAENLDDEADIATRIDELDFVFTAAISEADRRVTDALSKVKKPADPKDTVTDPPAPAAVDDTEMPAWAKGLVTSINTLSTTVTNMQQKETAKTISERFHADPRLKGLSPKILKGYMPGKEEDFEAAVELAAEELKEFVKADEDGSDETQTGGVRSPKDATALSDKPKFAAKKPGGADNKKQATKEELDAAVSKLVI